MALPSPLGTPEQSIKPLPEDEDSEDEALTRYIHPDLQGAQVQEEEGPPQSTCGWHECGLTFRRLEELVNHIHSAHVGTSKSTYRCMWEGCNLYGVTRTSRFALIGHIRSHTGERPFTCKLPECDKSFTRSDALTKHMRVVHGMETQFPKSNQQKKRKREDSDAEEEPFVAPDSNGEDDDAGDYDEDDAYNPRGRKGRGRRGKAAGHAAEASTVPVKVEGQQPPAIAATADAEPEVSDPESDEFLPEEVDPATGLVNGSRPSKARYLICKAKYRYAMGEHERLLETLKWLQEETQQLRLSKDDALNDLLKKQYGDELASSLLRPSMEKAPRVA